MSNVAVILPTLPPDSQTLALPDSMRPDDKAFLIRELGKISKDYAMLNARDEEHRKALESRFKRLEARMGQLEHKADASGQHNLTKVEQELERQLKRQLEIQDRWRGRVWSIIAVLVTSAVVGLITHYLSAR